jgi:hypothetical protein
MIAIGRMEQKLTLVVGRETITEGMTHMTNDEYRPELDRLERDAERSRAQLTDTVDHLGERLGRNVSAAAIKEEIGEYLVRRANENPLLALGAAAAVGYPLWRFLANIPLPVLLVGAGVAVSGSAPRSGRNGNMDGTQGRSISAMADDQLAASSESLSRIYERNPLVVSAIGMALGAVFGTALPRSAAEAESVGSMSRDLQQKAKDSAKEVADEFYRTAAGNEEPGKIKER